MIIKTKKKLMVYHIAIKCKIDANKSASGKSTKHRLIKCFEHVKYVYAVLLS